jgi:hypothetical protein
VPVVHVTAVQMKDKKGKGYYTCPIYTTSARGATIVTSVPLKMESEDSDPHKWILGGVALLQAPE